MNKKQFICLVIISLTFLTALYILFNYKSPNGLVYFAESGTLNLDHSSLNNNKIVTLNGEWFFYPDALIADINDKSTSLIKEVPHFWEEDADLEASPFGYGTYTLKVTGLEPSRIYGVYIADEVTSYTLFVNDKEVASNGIVEKSKGNYEPYWQPKTSVFQADQNGTAKFIMEISNFDYHRGGFWNSIDIGKVEAVLNYTQNERAKEVFLFTSIFIFGLINFCLFTVNKKDKATLYFSLFCFSIAFCTSMIGQRIIVSLLPAYNWHIFVRLEYIAGYMLLPLFGLFMLNLLEIKPYQIWLKRFFVAFIAFCFIVVLIPNNLYSALMEPYKWAAFIFAVYFAYMIYKSTMIWKNGHGILMIAIAVMFISILKEIFIGGLVSWVPYASLIFVLCFSLIIAKRFLELIRTKELLETKIIRDSLTGLYNRNYLEDLNMRSSELDQNQKKYIMFLDLDDFKNINDTYGHEIGDFILQETGQRLGQILRSNDTICRYGGDEFVIIVTAENDSEIRNIAERIIQEIQYPFEREGNRYHIGISIGISSKFECIENIEAHIKFSDEAMYQAKKNGKNQYAFYGH